MRTADFIIAFLTICCLYLSHLLPGPRDWYHSVKRKPFAAFLIFISIAAFFLGSPRGMHTIVNDPMDTVRLFRIATLSLMTLLAVMANLGGRNRASNGGSLRWMGMYAFLAMFSTAYSKFPLLSLYKGFEVATFVVLGLFIGTILHTWQDIEDIVNIMLYALWYLVISALISTVIAPSEAFPSMISQGSMAFALQGVFPIINANTLTQLAGTSACCSLCWFFRLSKFWQKVGGMAVVLAALLCMALAHSRTSLLVLPVAVFIVLWSFRKKGLAILTASLGGIIIASAALSQFVVAYVMRGQSMQTMEGLSGRTNFWPLVLERIYQAPILGHGFYASQRLLFGTASVDNSYLEVLLGIGVVGLIVFCLAILGVILNLWSFRPLAFSRKQPPVIQFVWTELVIIFFFLLVRSFTGPSFEVLHLDLTLFILVTVCAAAGRRLTKKGSLSPKEAPALVEAQMAEDQMGALGLYGNRGFQAQEP